MEKSLAFTGLNTLERDLCPLGNNTLYVLCMKLRGLFLCFSACGLFLFCEEFRKLSLSVSKLSGFFHGVAHEGFFKLCADFLEFRADSALSARPAVIVKVKSCRCLIHRIDGLVGKEPVAHIARGKSCAGFKSIIADGDLVMLLV